MTSARSETADAAQVAGHAHSVRVATRLPPWMGSIRFRIALLYSVILFGLAAMVVAVIYIGLARSLSDEPISRQVTNFVPVPGGYIVREGVEIDPYLYIEQQANARALATLRNYSYGALGGLFFMSLAVGWLVSGRVLGPIGRMTRVARELSATDLSRRIDLQGPEDELKNLADTFDAMLERIDDAFESQRDFIHEASHELRNPLAVIRTNVDVALADPHASVEELRRTAEVVQASTERMSRLVDDLLVYARKGSLSMDRTTLDVASVVAEATEEFVATATAAGIRLESHAPPGLFVDGDRLAIRQALANLLANAIRLSPSGTIVRVTAGREVPWIWMAVTDEGPGIAPEDQDRVFQRFWRGEPGQHRTGVRSGLGLTIVRQVAEAHGGEIKLASEPGHGAAFALWLPEVDAPPADPDTATPSSVDVEG